MTTPDALPLACADAIEVFADNAKRSSTCLGVDQLDGCGPAGTQEVVFRWVVPATGVYTVSSTNVGNGVIESTGRVDAACATATTCTGISAMPYTGGQVIYFALEAPSGGCVTYDFLVDTN